MTAEWEELIGSDRDAAFGFLRPTQKLSSSYPCPSPGGDGCPRRVVRHSPDDIVAVCGCTPRQCDTLKLTKADIIVYELNPATLGASVAHALGITAGFSETGIPRTWCLGAYWPYAGFRFPVYMTIQAEPEDYRRVADRLTAQRDEPFILLAPTRELCDRECPDVLQKKKAALLIMSEALVLDDSNRLATQQPVEEMLSGFRAAVLPAPKDSSAMAFFPTPPDASWTDDVHMRFVDRHTVSIKVKSVTGTYNYAQMGMANSKNSRPTKQWELLGHFADAHGTFTWKHRAADRKNQKRKEKLAAALQAFFRIEGDPFQLTGDRKGWQALFSISPD